ncbi:hypothetical protein [Paenibacillus medicaginis]|uniref:Uncharacterized protein n=1 Tax=Paenibacillus medicaginis TaxID=1470560 RepID=A0ABV5BW72_9BACL
MKNKKVIFSIYVVSVAACIIAGFLIGPLLTGNHPERELGSVEVPNNLEEALYGADVVIKGVVSKVEEPEKRSSGVGFDYDVTPAIISVSEVVYGEVPEEKEITFLQHGIEKDNPETDFVHEGEQVYLILVKTSDGKYWSYNFDDGVWKVRNGKVVSETTNKVLEQLDGTSQNTFKAEIKTSVEEIMSNNESN